MRRFNLYWAVGLVFFASCRPSTSSDLQGPKLAKTIPTYYLTSNDDRLKLVRDTMFLDGSYYTGFYLGFHPSGDTAIIRGFYNRVPEGRQVVWNEQGVPVSSAFYINGKKEGLQQTWWPNKTPQLRYSTSDNDYEGEFLEWNSAGVLIKQFNYLKGQESGHQRLWWDNGTVRANYVIRNGRKYGLIGLKICANPNDSIR